MLILSRVSVDFMNDKGEKIFSIKPADRLGLIEAPEAIKKDPIFDLLVSDGSLEVVESLTKKKALEENPVKGTDASGKKVAKKTAKETEKKEESAETAADAVAEASEEK